MNNKLKPCPFCGESVARVIDNGVGDYFVLCKSADDEHGCAASTSDFKCETEEGAIDRWNTRHASPPACPIAGSVSSQILSRAEFGLKKYGTNCARTDLSPLDWITHFQQENMDAAVYAERLKGILTELQTELLDQQREIGELQNKNKELERSSERDAENLNDCRRLAEYYNECTDKRSYDWKWLDEQLHGNPLPKESPASVFYLSLCVLAATTLDYVQQGEVITELNKQLKDTTAFADKLVNRLPGEMLPKSEQDLRTENANLAGQNSRLASELQFEREKADTWFNRCLSLGCAFVDREWRNVRAEKAEQQLKASKTIEGQEVWKCPDCEQMNAGWAGECGRCERPRKKASPKGSPQ